MYGEHRPYGYVFGGSGGAYRAIACFEMAIDVWDGADPYIHGTMLSLPSMHSVHAHAFRVLADKYDQIVDALEPGGRGDMYAGLSEEERAALAEADQAVEQGGGARLVADRDVRRHGGRPAYLRGRQDVLRDRPGGLADLDQRPVATTGHQLVAQGELRGVCRGLRGRLGGGRGR